MSELIAGPFEHYGQILAYARKELDYVGPATDNKALEAFLKNHGLIIDREGVCLFVKEAD